MPDGFDILPPLSRSVQDIGCFEQQHKLPILSDILERLFAGTEADFLIYTNVDIGLQPDFYLAVQQFIARGFDAFVINRRTITKVYREVAQLSEIGSEKGQAHRGWDCFVFRRGYFPQFILGDICIGAPRAGLALLANLIAAADHFSEFTEEHLTFHLGDDRVHTDSLFQAYADHNSRQLDRVLVQLEQRYGRFLRNTPVGAYLFKRRVFGRYYESWSRHVYMPASWSQGLNRLLGKLPGSK